MSNRKCWAGLFALTLVLSAVCMLVKVSPVNAQATTEKNADKLLRHVVMFKFKSSSSESDVQKVIDAFRQLPEKIDTIADFEYGTDNSPEEHANGFTHCFLLTFKSEADRAKYLPHPAHKAFGEMLGPHLDKVLVVDYWAAK